MACEHGCRKHSKVGGAQVSRAGVSKLQPPGCIQSLRPSHPACEDFLSSERYI